MNQTANMELISGIKNLSAENEAARRLFSSFSTRKNDARETTVERASFLANADYGTMTAIFRRLDALGAGTFIVGRHGYPSRIEWKYSVRSVGNIGMGESARPEEVSVDAVKDDAVEVEQAIEGVRMLHHEFQLRDGLQVRFELPFDISEKEAERVATFVKALPF